MNISKAYTVPPAELSEACAFASQMLLSSSWSFQLSPKRQALSNGVSLILLPTLRKDTENWHYASSWAEWGLCLCFANAAKQQLKFPTFTKEASNFKWSINHWTYSVTFAADTECGIQIFWTVNRRAVSQWKVVKEEKDCGYRANNFSLGNGSAIHCSKNLNATFNVGGKINWVFPLYYTANS